MRIDPNILILHITEKCNMSCHYCYQGEREALPDMSEATARRAIQWFFLQKEKREKVTIRFFGGEPLLRFEFIQSLVRFARSEAVRYGHEVRFQITTNGSLFDATMADFALKHKISFLFSIDGRANTHNANRRMANGQDSYEYVTRNLGAMKRLEKLGCRMTVTAETIDDMAVNVAHLLSLGFTVIGFAPADNIVLDSEQLDIIEKQLDEIFVLWKQQLQKGRQIRIKPLWNYVRNSGQPLSSPVVMHCCECMRKCLSVIHNGDIFPCHRFAPFAFRLGNIDRDGFDSLLYQDIFSAEMLASRIGCCAINYRHQGDLRSLPPVYERLTALYEATAKRIDGVRIGRDALNPLRHRFPDR